MKAHLVFRNVTLSMHSSKKIHELKIFRYQRKSIVFNKGMKLLEESHKTPVVKICNTFYEFPLEKINLSVYNHVKTYPYRNVL